MLLRGLEGITPSPPAATPGSGNFYTVQHGEAWPPLPGNTLDLPFWDLGAGFYVLDDHTLDYAALQAQAELAALRAGKFQQQPGSSQMMMSSLASSLAYANPVFLTNLVATSTGAPPITASFSIAGGTNNVPYDILTTTNVAASLAQWSWLGIGYTSNSYTFSNQPADQAFYILAKPQKTMVAAWGKNASNQCNVPIGLSNVVAVAGGFGHSLALRNDGTVVAWGENDAGQGSVPPDIAGVTMIAAGWNHNVVLLTNGTVRTWGYYRFHETNAPPDLTNVTVISAQALQTLALRSNGTVVAWGDNSFGNTNVPAGLTEVTAIAAGGGHNLAVRQDGTVVGWGWNNFGQCTVPVGLSNVWDVAAGYLHSVALKKDGTVVAWGDNSHGECVVPAGLSNVVAIAAGGYAHPSTGFTLALQSDGTLAMWGQSAVATTLGGMSKVVAIGGGGDHALAIRTGPRTPVLTVLPVDQYQIPGGSATFTSRGVGLYGVGYQWKSNGVNIASATNATLVLTNIEPAFDADYAVSVSTEVGTIAHSVHLYVVLPPVITAISPTTNIACLYGNYLSFGVTATTIGQLDGFPLSYQWKFNGTNITGATSASYGITATNDSGAYSVTVANAAGSTNVSWWVAPTNAINVTNDLLLIFNSNSVDSSNVCAYYLAHRPMVAGASILPIGCTNTESLLPSEYTNIFVPQVEAWLTNNPTKRPQYVILFLDIPSRVHTNRPPPPGDTKNIGALPSVSYLLSTQLTNWRPFVMHLNMGTITDCKAYIDKLEYFGTNHSPGKLLISANSLGDHGNTNLNYVLDNVRHGLNYTNDVIDTNLNFSVAQYVDIFPPATNGLLNAGVPANAILFFDGVESYTNNLPPPPPSPHPTSKSNIAGYMCWGAHSTLGGDYATDGKVIWIGTNRWWIIETVESFNGQRATQSGSAGAFIEWFSSNAFGGSNHSCTPVGAVTHVEEPGIGGVNDSAKHFSLWASGKNFAIAAWDSRRTPYFQAVGDPLVTR